MRIFSSTVICFCFLFISPTKFTYAQFVDLESENPYKKVFVETDNFNVNYLNQLENAYPDIQIDSIKFSVLNDLAYYWHTRNLVKAMDFTEKGLFLTIKKKDTLWNGRFQITKGAILLRMEKLDEAEYVLKSAKLKVQRKDLPFLNTQLGYVYERRGQLDKATDFAMKSLRLGEEIRDKKAIAIAYSDVSNLFWKQSKFETALEYGFKSLAVFEEIGITDLDYNFTLYVMGNNYLALKDYEKAMNYFEHAIVIGERYGFYNNLSDVYISLVDLYAFLGEFDKATEAGVNAIKYAELLTNKFMLMRSWLSIGKHKNLEKNYPEAIKSLEKSIEIATKDFGDEFYLSQAYEALGSAYAGNNDYKKAYHVFSEYDTLKTLVFTAEADQRTSLLRTEFEVAKKESKISAQETQIKRQRLSQNLVIIISALLFLLLLLSYKAIRNKLKINKLLRKQNDEKEFLLKEVHHRVKNNLETVSSLLSLQSAHIQDPGILNAMEESRHRVYSMGMIHQQLYMGDNKASIEMKDYFTNLSDYIIDAFGAINRIRAEVYMNSIELDVDIAIPIGLIVNELLTNSLKYAFPDNRKGCIRISLKETGNILQLDVTDDGVGSSSGTTKGTGFGTQLISLLTKQLDGKIELNTSKGTAVSIQFQLSKAA